MEEPIYFREVKDGIGSKPVTDLTPLEISEALLRKGQIDLLQREVNRFTNSIKILKEQCEHVVRYDTDGHPYMIRHCAGCGKTLGYI